MKARYPWIASPMANSFVISLMGRVQALRMQGLIKPLPIHSFHASKAEAAFKACLERPLSSNIALTLNQVADIVQVCLSTIIWFRTWSLT